MHEDVNLVKRKPYIESKDSDGRPDTEVAEEYWQQLHERDRSIFVDTFYGQLKSHLMCTTCGHTNTAFDPFSVLSVPIPQRSKPSEQIVEIQFYPNDITSQQVVLKLLIRPQD